MEDNTPPEDELASFFDAVALDAEKEMLTEFVEWYAIHYGVLIGKDVIDRYIEETNKIK